MDVVELDPSILRVATEQFQFQESDRLRVLVQDGIQYINSYFGMILTINSFIYLYINNPKGKSKISRIIQYIFFTVPSEEDKYKIIMFDVDCKNSSLGLSCPPEAFLDSTFLKNMHENGLHKDGKHFTVNFIFHQ